MLIFYDTMLTLNLVFNKQNDYAITFGNDIFENRRVLTTKHPASTIRLGVSSASNG